MCMTCVPISVFIYYLNNRISILIILSIISSISNKNSLNIFMKYKLNKSTIGT